MYEDDWNDYDASWAEQEGEKLSNSTISRFAISKDDLPFGGCEFEGWNKYHWGYDKDGWKVLVGKNDGIRIRACIVSPNDIVCSGWFPVDLQEDVERRILEAERLMREL